MPTAWRNCWAAWKKGEIEESSRFELTGEGVRPLTYRKLDGFSDRDRDVEAAPATERQPEPHLSAVQLLADHQVALEQAVP